MATVEHFEELEVWQLARALVGKIYRLAKQGEFAKDFGFRNQICRAAVSIVSNIAEGFERRSGNQFQQFWTSQTVRRAKSAPNSTSPSISATSPGTSFKTHTKTSSPSAKC